MRRWAQILKSSITECPRIASGACWEESPLGTEASSTVTCSCSMWTRNCPSLCKAMLLPLPLSNYRGVTTLRSCSSFTKRRQRTHRNRRNCSFAKSDVTPARDNPLVFNLSLSRSLQTPQTTSLSHCAFLERMTLRISLPRWAMFSCSTFTLESAFTAPRSPMKLSLCLVRRILLVPCLVLPSALERCCVSSSIIPRSSPTSFRHCEIPTWL
mmetsp:Transcript_31171/g.51963  ORF Transcript_31171/g.51963 Transcript_31171/m.51963 type:complete len:212 (-) Transcript_31171:4198-4833(-)